MLVIYYDTVSDIPDIIIVQVIEFVSITLLYLTCVPYLSVVTVKLKVVVSLDVLLTKAAVNPVLSTLLTCPELTVAMYYLIEENTKLLHFLLLYKWVLLVSVDTLHDYSLDL